MRSGGRDVTSTSPTGACANCCTISLFSNCLRSAVIEAIAKTRLLLIVPTFTASSLSSVGYTLPGARKVGHRIDYVYFGEDYVVCGDGEKLPFRQDDFSPQNWSLPRANQPGVYCKSRSD